MAEFTTDTMNNFRRSYRANISSNYNGWIHMLSVLLVGLCVIGYALSQLRDVSAQEWLVFPLTMLLVNFAEYYVHRWLGHKKTRYGKLFYQRHTGDHHSFFLDGAMAFESVRDWRVVLFPVYLIFAFIIGLVLPIGYFLYHFASPNCAYLYSAAGISGYLFYEIMHFSYHIPKESKAVKVFGLIPGWKYLRHTHVLHHKRDTMSEANFNITLPIFDLALGTLYWEPIQRSD